MGRVRSATGRSPRDVERGLDRELERVIHEPFFANVGLDPLRAGAIRTKLHAP